MNCRCTKADFLQAFGLVFCILRFQQASFAGAFVSVATARSITKDNHCCSSFRYAVESSVSSAASSSSNNKTHHLPLDRRIAQRWNGNYKHGNNKLSDVSKAKKLQLPLSIQHVNGTITTKVVIKKRQETLQHVLTKAILWKLYADDYPDAAIAIELDIGDPDYLPDVISLDVTTGRPLFWGESGRMKVHKAMDLMRRYPEANIVHARWDMTMDEIASPLEEHLQALFDHDQLEDLAQRPGRFTFCSLPLDVWRFINGDTGMILLSRDDLEWRDLSFPTTKSNH